MSIHRKRKGRRLGPSLLALGVLALALLDPRSAVSSAAPQTEDATKAAAAARKLDSRQGRGSGGGGSTWRRRSKTAAASSPVIPVVRVPSTLEHLVAGTVGGVSGALVSYPLDTVRVRMQTNGKLMGPGRTASLLLNEAGIAGFYRGVLSPMVGTGLIKAAVFGGYGLCQGLVRRATGRESGDLNLFHLGVAAMGSGLVGSFVVTPVERIKVVMQAAMSSSSSSSVVAGVAGSGGGYANAWGCARGLVAEHGLRRGLYAGLGPTLLREVPGYACYFATYEACKRVLLGREGGDASQAQGAVMFKTAVSGALAGIAAWLPVYPADVVKSRMQQAGASGGGMLSTASLMWKSEGFAPFYRGLSPTIVRAMVNHAATFLVYEAAMGLMRRERKASDTIGSDGSDKSTSKG
eukprot:g10309.t1